MSVEAARKPVEHLDTKMKKQEHDNPFFRNLTRKERVLIWI
jgi:hypothetical protein